MNEQPASGDQPPAPAAPAVAEQTIWKGSSSHFVNLGTYLVCGFFSWLIFPLFIALYKWLQNKCRVFEITTERIKISRGVFSRRTDEVELYRVQDYVLEEPFRLRLFHLGNIVVTSSDNTNPVVLIEGIPDAAELRDQIRTSVERCRDRKRVRVTEFE